MRKELRAAIGGALKTLPGIQLGTIRDAGTNRTQTRIDIGIVGWSPSLHSHSMVWKAATRTGLDVDASLRDVLDSVLIEVGNQRSRAARATATGISAPILTSGITTPVGHVMIDAGLLALMRQHESRPLRSIVGESVSSLHACSGSGTSDVLSEDDWVDGCVWHRMERVADRTVFDGEQLWVGGTILPETTLARFAGRRLGEVATVPAILADRIVVEARSDDTRGGTEIEVRPILSTIDDHERLAA